MHVYIANFKTNACISFDSSHIEYCYSFCVVDSKPLYVSIAITLDGKPFLDQILHPTCSLNKPYIDISYYDIIFNALLQHCIRP